jgi:hypothetical protein
VEKKKRVKNTPQPPKFSNLGKKNSKSADASTLLKKRSFGDFQKSDEVDKKKNNRRIRSASATKTQRLAQKKLLIVKQNKLQQEQQPTA